MPLQEEIQVYTHLRGYNSAPACHQVKVNKITHRRTEESLPLVTVIGYGSTSTHIFIHISICVWQILTNEIDRIMSEVQIKSHSSRFANGSMNRARQCLQWAGWRLPQSFFLVVRLLGWWDVVLHQTNSELQQQKWFVKQFVPWKTNHFSKAQWLVFPERHSITRPEVFNRLLCEKLLYFQSMKI